MPEKCILDPDRDCLGIQKANDVSGEVRALSKQLSSFQQSVSETHVRFGSRIGELEAREKVRDEQYKNIQEKLKDITQDMSQFQKDQKDSISDLRAEHKTSMEELKRGNKEILEIVTPLRQKAGEIDKLSEDVAELKEKPGETWEHIKKQGLGWIVAFVLAILAVALGLGKYL